jgi:hypothetical protein
MSRIEYRKLSNVSAIIAVAIFTANVLVGRFWKPYIVQALGDSRQFFDSSI